ncbi:MULTISPECIES: hypothetical protein [Sporosarcina]|uniref:Group-specific protein n=2 Tax=Sporosarcina newyorkensis TaxID=759851 RepID=A0A1T4YZ10_9BACL|nr:MULTISPECIES: hypothetical protein [Sporosarcina]EGQ24133.1 hypothetical protein HMPREF9372_2576 [Sporosarcina newyorkensis 2681]MBY0223428.1 group-specific protein [Sporosarcina aquimarina]SKB06551.1 hypothetical protein SAMN04244570_0185 [Sporosarcina newyorkensis]
MSRCTIDHSQNDVLQKLKEQHMFLPKDLFKRSEIFLSKPLDQGTLNEVFHLLKKYDLATGEERMERNKNLEKLYS